MANTDWPNKSLKIQQIDREQKAYQAGKEEIINDLMLISSVRQPNPELSLIHI